MLVFELLLNLLTVGLAAVCGTRFGRRVGACVVVVLSASNVFFTWQAGASGEALPAVLGSAFIALVVSAAVGTLRDRWRQAQSDAAAAAYARDLLETEIAGLVRADEGRRVRAEQHAAVATISQHALRDADLSMLIDLVVRRVAEVLAVDSCTFWQRGAEGELLAQGGYTSLLTGGGPEEGLTRHARYTSWVGEPVVVADLRTDPRLRGAPVEGRLTCGVMVPLPGQGAPHPVLGAHSVVERTFGTHEVAFLESVAQVLAAAIERQTARDGLERQALHDPLTGLANRSLFQDRLTHSLQVAMRENAPLALLLMDLDRFKEINDTLGHQAGDRLLVEVGTRLHRVKRAADTAARLGGDEFALILPAVPDMATACQLARKLLEVVERPMMLDGQSVDIGASIGVALYPDHGEDAEELLRRADVAMYVAKRNGDGVAAYASDQDRHSRSRLALSSALRQAIEAGELALYFQPQVDFRTGEIGGLEALLRWQHPELGLVEPDTFIPIAEQMGLIATLDRWALDAALQQAREWQADGRELPISVNLSMRSVLDPSLTQFVGDLLIRWDIPPARLELEITESSIMADPQKVRAVLAQCRALGVGIAIDDFGTGYSSLAYLKRLPVDTLKIDKSFVLDMAVDKSDLAIVRSTIELGHNLGLRVVAEGVEDETTSRILSHLRCDLAQGHYFSPALPGAEVLPRLEDSRWRQPATRFAA